MTEEVKKETKPSGRDDRPAKRREDKIARLAAVGCVYLCGSHFYYDHGVS